MRKDDRERVRRNLTRPERGVLLKLLSLAGREAPEVTELDRMEVEEMRDGEMGSLYLLIEGREKSARKFGGRVAEFQFNDEDGVPVLVSLNIDLEGDLFEVDVWKADFRPLISFQGAVDVADTGGNADARDAL